MPSPPRLLVHAALIGVSVLFGINFVGMKIVLGEVPASAWALVRIAAATAFLAPLAWFLRPAGSRPSRRILLALVPAAILGVGGNQLLFALGLHRTTPAHASVITACVPILTLVAAVVARQEQLRWHKVASLVLALTGVLILLEVDLGIPDDGGTWTGDLLVLTNATTYAIYLVVMRRLGRHIDAPTATALCFGYSVLFVLPFAAPAFDASTAEALVAPGVFGWVAFAILGSTVTTYLLNNWALRHADSSLVALYIYTQPIVATALSTAMGHDLPGTRFFLAAALVFAGLCVSTVRRRARG
ncbi:MAG: DMT family transporter [Planctomycetota bacterium]|nr:DMT family transporter [Planctomycetota bacterium]MDA0933031.1 DMT family transporter [Planctomycetota bacterium]MDA1221685.1 DMT family transporter [Planctomycetota bacterium]